MCNTKILTESYDIYHMKENVFQLFLLYTPTRLLFLATLCLRKKKKNEDK